MIVGGRGAAERPLPVGKHGEVVPSNIPDFSRAAGVGKYEDAFA